MAEAVSARTADRGPRGRPGKRESAERFDPAVMAGGLLEAEHRARYWWASRLAPEKRVLDAGCGVGYGAQMLASAGAKEVVGVDNADDAIEEARRAADKGVQFRVADVRNLPFESGAFDLVVCFEVIEHVHDRVDVFAELKRVLTDAGVLLVSSPNRRVYLPGNPHHVYEYEPEELRLELARLFSNVDLYRQHVWIATAVMTDDDFSSPDADHELRISTHKLAPDVPEQETYTIAAASDGAMEEMRSLAVLGEPFEVRAWQERVDAVETELEKRARSLEELKSYIAWLEKQHERGVATAAKLQKALWEAHELLLQRDEQLVRAQGTLDARQELERAGNYARSLEGQIYELKAYQETLQGDIGNLTSENELLLGELETLKDTRVWRAATRYWSSRDRVRRIIGRGRPSGGASSG